MLDEDIDKTNVNVLNYKFKFENNKYLFKYQIVPLSTIKNYQWYFYKSFVYSVSFIILSSNKTIYQNNKVIILSLENKIHYLIFLKPITSIFFTKYVYVL